ncbi:hypothetical protein SAMN05216223_113164 [Actinacidiphila yanglinensis]|uniref:Uncharacterized protein n=1 Tax=Actinacidiphila yanglinensis TaxID=310779 RepID=A0A1H6DBE2_9ACTN|nr:hypothetical protein [Actinacidiphila yanglinensis]SEG82559.1 hypothetical protein SAMN05216223_113164 [Actinacidiphila yanglinensis]
MVMSLVTACTGHRDDPDAPGRVGNHYTVLQRSVANGVHWQLDAYVDVDGDGSFCMGLDGPKGPDHSATLPWANAACGFDNSDSGGYYGGGMAPGRNASISYGPVPDAAAAVRVSTKEVVPTHPFPKGHGLPDGRYWVIYEPASWPGKGDKSVDPQPLDASGNKVAFKNF